MKVMIARRQLDEGALQQFLPRESARVTDWDAFTHAVLEIRRAQPAVHAMPVEIGALS